MSQGKKSQKSWWRPLVEGVDTLITPPANALVRTNAFADAVAIGTRFEARLRRRIEAQSTWLLHQYNLPSATDIRRMRAQLAALEARLRDMDERLEDSMLENRRANSQPTARKAAAEPK